MTEEIPTIIELIEEHIEQAHAAKRGLRGHFTPHEYNTNWRALKYLVEENARLEKLLKEKKGGD